MKRFVAILSILFVSTCAYSQKKLKEYRASNNKLYKPGDTIKLGVGSDSNGEFKSIESGNWKMQVLFGPAFVKPNSEAGNTKHLARQLAILKKIKSEKIHGVAQVSFMVDIDDNLNYTLFIEDAISDCELADCVKNLTPTVVEISQSNQPDKFDLLKKLKDLLDSGAITQAEYDEQKKKLLAQ